MAIRHTFIYSELSGPPIGIQTARQLKDAHPEITYKTIKEKEAFLCRPFPLSGKKDTEIIVFPEYFYMEIPEVRVFGKDGIIITPDNHILDETSWELAYHNSPSEYSCFKKPHLPPITGTEKRIAVMAYPESFCYYHWMFNIIPRFILLKELGIEPDRYYLSYENLPFQEESLRILGIDFSKILVSNDETHIQAGNLLVPAVPLPQFAPPKWTYDLLRNLFLEKVHEKPAKKIYISRKKASQRRVLNETEVLDLLAKYGFEEIVLEGEPLKKQAETFAEASHIVTIHGSALTNMVFCDQNVKLIEYYPPNYINECFWKISQQMGIEHYCLFGDQTGLKEEELEKKDIKIDLHTLDKLLKKIL